jgi:hypothetical protein
MALGRGCAIKLIYIVSANNFVEIIAARELSAAMNLLGKRAWLE